MSITERVSELEEQFKINNYYGDKSRGIYNYKRGSIPIMVSAPHSVKQIRNNNVKAADVGTGGIAIVLHELTDCHVIYRTFTANGDANRDLNCNYKRELVKKLAKNNIKYLIDLHGMRRDRPHDIDVGTLNGLTTDWITDNLIIDKFTTHGIKDVRFNYLFDGTPRGTVTRTVYQQLGIICFQLELNERYRNPEEEENMIAIINSLKYLILYLLF
ncbi:N-formylglutamate amidohydrolase [Alkaliphilus peptidifermentans]|uniref:N-formylglutamate amidohydrolase n=1 Tax=Alkaliphilus peptidifermentans DSM 18978 TaxID=1120976 RepID=A0A1G5EVD5_9FIRM|nr:hypothetical protein [Alkaliphilus peptidifermentans]SCY30949.1 hypothetical protein SAMN03080606_01239 [Alkaliphilus peptidifermentans DSM 18978]